MAACDCPVRLCVDELCHIAPRVNRTVSLCHSEMNFFFFFFFWLFSFLWPCCMTLWPGCLALRVPAVYLYDPWWFFFV